MRVLVACEHSNLVRDTFIRHGHDAISCDLLPPENGGPHYQGDVTLMLELEWDLIIAHPPCTRLTNAGARWLHKPPTGKTLDQIWAELDEGVRLYKLLRDAPARCKAIENPIMHKHARERIQPGHRQVVQPWHFGDPQFKAVGLELINLPDLVETNRLTPPKPGTDEHKAWSRVHRMPPGPERAKERSRFFPGIAEAMAVQWGAL